jgi:hypothetical protein
MPFCPMCHYEYLPSVSECPDCKVKLVSSLPLKPEESEDAHDPENWVPLARFTSTQYAGMVLEALESKDIPAMLSDQTGYFGRISQMELSSSPPLSGGVVILYVHEEFAEEASQEGRLILGEDWDKAKLVDSKD